MRNITLSMTLRWALWPTVAAALLLVTAGMTPPDEPLPRRRPRRDPLLA